MIKIPKPMILPDHLIPHILDHGVLGSPTERDGVAFEGVRATACHHGVAAPDFLVEIALAAWLESPFDDGDLEGAGFAVRGF